MINFTKKTKSYPLYIYIPLCLNQNTVKSFVTLRKLKKIKYLGNFKCRQSMLNSNNVDNLREIH